MNSKGILLTEIRFVNLSSFPTLMNVCPLDLKVLHEEWVSLTIRQFEKFPQSPLNDLPQ